MAVYYNLGVDCGPTEIVARKVARHFRGFSIPIPDYEPALCDLTVEEHRSQWFVGVWPCGMSYGSPMHQDRSELVDETMVHHIGEKIYARLATIRGFRRAKFGGECFDQLAFATAEEDDDIGYVGMVYRVCDFPSEPADCVVRPFSDDYRIVIDVKR